MSDEIDPIIISTGGSGPDEPSTPGSDQTPPGSGDDVIEEELGGGTLASQLKAKLAKARTGTHEFPVPGWDGQLIVVARVLRDRREWANTKYASFIAKATEAIIWIEDDGITRRTIGGWRQLADHIGMHVESAAHVVRIALDNPARLDMFAGELIEWMATGSTEVEQELGE